MKGNEDNKSKFFLPHEQIDEWGATELHRSTRKGDIDLCEWLISKGADVNARDNYGATPLYWAAWNGGYDLAKLLLNQGSNSNIPDYGGETPLYWASTKRHYEIVRLLCDRGAKAGLSDNKGFSTLTAACKDGNLKMIKLLLDRGADPNGGVSLHIALELYHNDIVKILVDHEGCDVDKMKKNEKLTPLMIAAKTNSEEALDWLLDKGADPDRVGKKGFTALTYAIVSESECASIISKLFKITFANLEISLQKLAESAIVWDNEFNKASFDSLKESLYDKLEKKTFIKFIERASFFANRIWLGWLLQLEKFEQFIDWEKLCENVIKSDNGDACKIVTANMKKKNIKVKLSNDLKEIALEKGIKKILEAFDLSEEESQKLIERKNRASLSTPPNVIKCAEFQYTDIISMLVKLIKNRFSLSFHELLKAIKAPTVHFATKTRNECPKSCPKKQRSKCNRVRQTQKLIMDIIREIAKKFSIFEGVEMNIVGSMKEDTKERL